ncbi:MAG: TolC family protein [Bacteroidia bacterium]
MMFKIKTLIVFVLLSAASFAQNTYNLSVQQAVELAKQKNANLKNAQLDKAIARQQIKEIVATGLPQINGQLQFLHNPVVATMALPDFISPAVYGTLVGYGLVDPTNPSTPPPPARILPAQFGVKNNLTASVSASQLVFDGGFLMGVKASKEYAKLSSLSAQQIEQEVELDVKKAYYGVQLLQTSLTSFTANINLLQQTANEVAQTYKVGFAEKIDADRIKLALSNTTIQRDKLADQLAISKQYLKLLLGIEPNDSINLTEDIEKIEIKNNQSTLNETAQRIELKILEQQKKLNLLDKRRWQYGYVPSLVAFGSYQQNTFGANVSDLGKQWFEGISVGATLNVPLFDGLRKDALVQKNKINDKKIENGKKVLQNTIEIERFTAKSKYSRALQQYQVQADNAKLAEDIFKRASIRYREGLGSSLELTTAQTDLLTAQNNKLQAIFELLIAEAELKKVNGNN